MIFVGKKRCRSKKCDFQTSVPALWARHVLIVIALTIVNGICLRKKQKSWKNQGRTCSLDLWCPKQFLPGNKLDKEERKFSFRNPYLKIWTIITWKSDISTALVYRRTCLGKSFVPMMAPNDNIQQTKVPLIICWDSWYICVWFFCCRSHVSMFDSKSKIKRIWKKENLTRLGLCRPSWWQRGGSQRKWEASGPEP